MPVTTVRNPLSPRACGNVSILEAQRIKKIRVNRVSLIQELRVEYVLGPLVEKGVLSVPERDFILQGTSVQDKTRRLIDLIPTKGKNIDWFNIFRNVLRDPEGDQDAKACCQRIITYLDNTIISKPQDVSRANVVSPISQTDKQVKKMSLPKYNPLPCIGKDSSASFNEGDFTSRQSVVRFNLGSEIKNDLGMSAEESEPEYEIDDNWDSNGKNIGATLNLAPRRLWFNTSVEPYFRKPTELFEMLRKGESDGDMKQLDTEGRVWKNVQRLEVPLDLFHKKKLEGPFDFLLCKEVYNILVDAGNHHLYLKYLNQLKYEKYVDLLKELDTLFSDIFEHLKPVEDKETRDHITELGFGLSSLFLQYAYFAQAEKAMSTLVHYLCSSESMDCWIQQFNGYVKLFGVRIACLEFTKADQAYYSAQKIAQQIEGMAYGQDMFRSAELYLYASQLMRQRGSISPAYTRSQKALEDVDPNDHALVINIMCESVKTSTSQWSIKQAELLALEAVRRARTHFGTNHPLYLKALLHYCHFSCLFRKDTMGVNVSMYALEIAQKIYGVTDKDQDIDLINSTLPLAHAHRELAKAIGLCKTGMMDSALGFDHANRAYRMALDILPGLHPHLSKFRYTLASCALWKEHSQMSSAEIKEDLEWAMSKVKESMRDAKEHFGDISLKCAKLHGLLGQIYVRLERYEDAENELTTSVHLLKHCMAHNSNHIYLAEGALATFYKCVGQPADAIELYMDVVDHADTGLVYAEWVDSTYSALIDLLHATNDTASAAIYQAKHKDWLNINQPLPDSDFWTQQEEPPTAYEELLGELNIWTKRAASTYSGVNLNHGGY